MIKKFGIWSYALREAEGEGGGPEAEPGADPQAADPKPAPKTDWRAVKIAKQAAALAERDNEIAQLRAAVKPAAPVPGTTPTVFTEEEVERRATAKAAEMSAQQSFTAQCMTAAEKGEATYGKEAFQTEVSTLITQLRDEGTKGQTEWNSFLQAALDTGAPEQVLHNLAADPDKAARIYALPPIKRAIELDRLVTKERREVSETPKPLPKVSTRSNSTVNISASDARSDNLDSSDWHARRAAEVAARSGGRPQRLQPKSART